jgi:hypothetical protein
MTRRRDYKPQTLEGAERRIRRLVNVGMERHVWRPIMRRIARVVSWAIEQGAEPK